MDWSADTPSILPLIKFVCLEIAVQISVNPGERVLWLVSVNHYNKSLQIKKFNLKNIFSLDLVNECLGTLFKYFK